MTGKNRLRRWLVWLGISTAILAAAGFAGIHFAAAALKSRIEQAIGPTGEIGSIELSARGVEIRDLRIRASRSGGKIDWPVEDQLRAGRIVVTPDFRDLLSARIVVSSIEIEGAYLSMQRTRGGKLRVLPALLETPTAAPAATGTEITIGQIRLRNCAIEFIDASIDRQPVRMRLEKVTAELDDLHLPDLRSQSRLKVDATIKGPQRDGKVSLAGRVEIASKNSELELQLRGVDLVALQPYLIKAAETGVRKGSLDLEVKSSVRSGRLKAPGSLTLAGLELAPGSSFMGMPRNAVVGMLKDKNDRITVKFVLEGNLTDPKFSLNENIATRIGASVADTLGVSIEGLAKGVGSAGRGIGEAVGKLFGK